MGISSYRCQPIVDGVGKPELKRATILYAIPAGEKCRTTSWKFMLYAQKIYTKHTLKRTIVLSEAWMPRWHGPWRKRRPPNTAI